MGVHSGFYGVNFGKSKLLHLHHSKVVFAKNQYTADVSRLDFQLTKLHFRTIIFIFR